MQNSTLVCIWELRQEGKMTPCPTLAGNLCIGWLKIFTAVHISANDCESTVSMDFGVTNKIQQVGEFNKSQGICKEGEPTAFTIHLLIWHISIEGLPYATCPLGVGGAEAALMGLITSFSEHVLHARHQAALPRAPSCSTTLRECYFPEEMESFGCRWSVPQLGSGPAGMKSRDAFSGVQFHTSRLHLHVLILKTDFTPDFLKSCSFLLLAK